MRGGERGPKGYSEPPSALPGGRRCDCAMWRSGGRKRRNRRCVSSGRRMVAFGGPHPSNAMVRDLGEAVRGQKKRMHTGRRSPNAPVSDRPPDALRVTPHTPRFQCKPAFGGCSKLAIPLREGYWNRGGYVSGAHPKLATAGIGKCRASPGARQRISGGPSAMLCKTNGVEAFDWETADERLAKSSGAVRHIRRLCEGFWASFRAIRYSSERSTRNQPTSAYSSTMSTSPMSTLSPSEIRTSLTVPP